MDKAVEKSITPNGDGNHHPYPPRHLHLQVEKSITPNGDGNVNSVDI